MSTVTKPEPSAMSPRGAMLLVAMRLNLAHLIELEKTDGGAVVVIVEALIAHLRSWKPLAATAVPSAIEAPPDAAIDAATQIERTLAGEQRYCVKTHVADGERFVVISATDEFENAHLVLTPSQAATLREDIARVQAALGALR